MRFSLIIFVVLVSAFLLSSIPLEIVFPLVIFCAGLFICVDLVMLSPKENYGFLLFLLIGAFISRIVISLFLYNFVYIYKGTGLMGDMWSYSENGYYILQMWLGGIRNMDQIAANMMKITTSGNLGSYDFWNAIVYYLTGKSPLSLIFINCMTSSLTAIFIYYITKQLYNEKAAKISAILTAFWPSLFSWSIQNTKEPSSIFLIAILIWAILQLRIKFRFYLLFLIVLSSIALKELRMVSFFMFYTVIFPVSLILSLWKRNRVLFMFLIILAGLLMVFLINGYLKEFLPKAKYDFSFFRWIYERRSERAYGNTAFLTNLNIDNPLSFIFFMSVATLVAWLAPFPWQVGSMSQIAVMPEMLLYYLLLPAVFSGWRFIMRYKIKEGGIIILYIIIMMLVLAFIEGNIGTLFRHRAMVLPFLFILIGVGLSQRNKSEIVNGVI